LTNTITLDGAEASFGTLTVTYPDNWAAEQDGFNLVVSNNVDTVGRLLVNGGYFMPASGNVGILALTQGVMQYSQ